MVNPGESHTRGTGRGAPASRKGRLGVGGGAQWSTGLSS